MQLGAEWFQTVRLWVSLSVTPYTMASNDDVPGARQIIFDEYKMGIGFFTRRSEQRAFEVKRGAAASRENVFQGLRRKANDPCPERVILKEDVSQAVTNVPE